MPHGIQKFDELVDEKREQAGLLGLGTIVVQNGAIAGISTSGIRKKGSNTPITVRDKWHIGSISKSLTATMLARLVEQERLSWDTSIADIFGKAENIHVDWRDVKLEDLLTHTSGARPNFSFKTALLKPEAGAMRMAARYQAVLSVLEQPPRTPPRKQFAYSNVGYTIAGVMAEIRTGLPWEDLVANEVFSTLGLTTGGFGVPQSDGDQIGEPWGHSRALFGFAISSQKDNTPIIGPAGTIHLSLKGLAAYGVEHLNGLKGKGTILKPQTYQRLHRPQLENYAYGWIVDTSQALGVGDIHWHNGSNTMWYALIAIHSTWA